MSKQKYLLGASLITTINLGTLSLLVAGSNIGFYFGLFTTAVFGIFQALVHTIGYL
jgi:hypothetical protein